MEGFFVVFGRWCTLLGPCALKRLIRFQAKKNPDPKKLNFLFFIAVSKNPFSALGAYLCS